MIKSFKLFSVKLYYYDGALEESLDDGLEYFRKHKENLKNEDQ